jgi:hypothetical protein
LLKLRGEKPENNSTAKNKTWMATENDGIIKIRALRRTYAGLNWVRENKKYLEANKFKTIFGYPDDTQWTVDQRTVTQYIVTDTLTGLENDEN